MRSRIVAMVILGAFSLAAMWTGALPISVSVRANQTGGGGGDKGGDKGGGDKGGDKGGGDKGGDKGGNNGGDKGGKEGRGPAGGREDGNPKK